MISLGLVNGNEFNELADYDLELTIGHFALTGEQLIKIPPLPPFDYLIVEWKYENDSELFALASLKDALDRLYLGCTIILNLPYVPNARMDRINKTMNVFTLKTFSKMLNAMKFNTVITYDVHSSVSLALIDNVIDMSPKETILEILNTRYDSKPVLFFPDEGAMKRYGNLFPDFDISFGIKHRDFSTGKIKRLEIVADVDLDDRAILIIDDISSYGGTFYRSSIALDKYNPKSIDLYVSHCENSILKGKIFTDSSIRTVFTTDSIFTKEHDNITIVQKGA